MKRIPVRWLVTGLLLAVMFTSLVQEAAAEKQRQDSAAQLLAQYGRTVKGTFKSMNTKGVKWTVTIRPLHERVKKTYPLAADVLLTYKGDQLPWQRGVIIDSDVELLIEHGEVKVINVLEWSS
jgi:leucyl aminopeptidase (aminopeptidase T)